MAQSQQGEPDPVDNMTLRAAELHILIRLFETLDLSHRCSDGSAQRFAVKGCGKETLCRETVCLGNDKLLQHRRKVNSKFRVMLAGIDLDAIETVHELLEFARVLCLEVLNDSERLEEDSHGFRLEHWGHFHPRNLLPAILK